MEKVQFTKIEYLELIVCIAIIVTTFQISVFLIDNIAFFDDQFDFLRFLILSIFFWRFYKDSFRNTFSKVFVTIFTFFLTYSIFVFITLQLASVIDPSAKVKYVEYVISKEMKQHSYEITSKGYNINEDDTRKLLEQKIQAKESFYVASIYFILNIFFLGVLSLLIAWITGRPI